MDTKTLERISKLMNELHFPENPRCDWENTNHFELQGLGGNDGFWWWSFDDLLGTSDGHSKLNPDDTDISWAKLGLLLELAIAGAEAVRGFKP